MSPPERPSPGEYDPTAYDVELSMSPGCISNLELTEGQLRESMRGADWDMAMLMEEHLNIHHMVFHTYMDNRSFEYIYFDNSEADIFEWDMHKAYLEESLAWMENPYDDGLPTYYGRW